MQQQQQQQPPLLRTNYKQARRLETVYTGGAVAASRVPAQGGFVVAAARAQDVVLVGPTALQAVQTLSGDESDVTALAVRPDGRRVAVAHTSHQLREYDIATATATEAAATSTTTTTAVTAKAARTWKLPGAFIAAMAYDPTGTLLALGCTDTRVRVWESAHGYLTHSLRVPAGGVVGAVAFCPGPPATRERPLLVAAAEDPVVRVWDLADRGACRELKGHMAGVTSIAFARGGATLITAGRDSVFNVWDMAAGSLLLTIPVFETFAGIIVLPGKIPSPPQSKKATTAVAKKTKKTKTTKRHVEMEEEAAAMEMEEKTEVIVGAGGESGALKAWSLSGTLLWAREGAAGGGGTGKFTRMICADDATAVAITEGQDMLFFPEVSAGIANPASAGEMLGRPQIVVGNRDQVADMQFLPGSDTEVVVVDNSERPQVVDLATGTTVNMLDGHEDIVLCCAVAAEAEGSRAGLVATGSKDRSVRLWDAKTGRCVGVCEGHTDAVSALAFIGKSKLVTAGNDTTLKVWELPASSFSGGEDEDEEEPWKLEMSKVTVRAHDKDVNSIAVSPNAKFLATASQDRTVKLWRAEDLGLEATFAGHRRGVWSVCFSPVDQVVASAAADATVRIWSLSTRACLKTLEGHGGPVLRVAFVSRGQQLLTTGADALVKLWTARTGECAATMDGHSDKIWALALAPDGTDGGRFATAGSDAAIVVWDDCTAEKAQAEREERAHKLAQEHDLQAMVASGKLKGALQAAFALKHPRRVLQILEAIIAAQDDGVDAEKGVSFSGAAGASEGEEAKPTLRGIVTEMTSEQVRQLLWYAVDWNTSAKHNATAQTVLSVVFRTWTPEKLQAAVPDLGRALEALIPYTERHMRHADSLLQRSHILDYTLATLTTAVAEHGSDDVPMDDQ